MEGPQATISVAGARIKLLGTIAGFVPDKTRVQAALADAPACIALGVPPEDLDALAALHATPELATELPEPDEWTQHRMDLLGRWGKTHIPSPDLDAAFAWAMDHQCPVEALDLDDPTHTEEHTRRLKVRHLVRMNRQRNKMLKDPFDQAADPYGFARQWDDAEHGLKPLAAIQATREQHMVERLQALARQHESILAIVPAPRFAGVQAGLTAAAAPRS